MQRRTFLASAGALGAGAIWLPGCAGAPASPTLGVREQDALAARLEHGTRAVRDAPYHRLRASQATEHVLRVGLESLVVADVARSIPPGTHLCSELTHRLQSSLPILDDSVATYHALLERTPGAARRALDRHFARKPSAAMDIAGDLDERAAELGISGDSRARMRNLARHITTRVRRQSTSALFDECAGKIETVVARHGADIRYARTLTANAMIAALWQQVEGLPGPASGLGSPAAPPAQAVDGERPIRIPVPSTGAPGDPELAVGGVLIGAGLVVFGIGGIIGAVASSVWPVVIAATPAGIAVVAGLIVLLVGAVQNASAG